MLWCDLMISEEDILYFDEHYVAVSKPAGLLMHPTSIARHENETLLKQVRNTLGRRVYPVHRLDRPTSGVVLFALSSDAAAKLCEMFAQRNVNKNYIAVVRGYTDDEGLIDYPLKPLVDKYDQKKSFEAQSAVTRYETISRVEVPVAVKPYQSARYSLLNVQPETGRQRQIRRHLKHVFHPIAGDPKHGDGNHNRMLKEHFGLNRLMLHAKCVEFVHPYSGEKVVVKAKLPPGFAQFLDRLKLGLPEL